MTLRLLCYVYFSVLHFFLLIYACVYLKVTTYSMCNSLAKKAFQSFYLSQNQETQVQQADSSLNKPLLEYVFSFFCYNTSLHIPTSYCSQTNVQCFSLWNQYQFVLLDRDKERQRVLLKCQLKQNVSILNALLKWLLGETL